MFHVEKIESLDRPELQPYRTMRRPQEQRSQGIFVAEGEKVVRRLLESKLTVVSVLLPENWVSKYEPLLRARPEDLPVFLADKKLLETLVGYSMYQGLLAVGRVPTFPALKVILAESNPPRLWVAIDALANAENLGALVRNCAAFNVHGLIVGETSSSPYLRRAVRNSMGTIFEMPVVESPNLVQSLRELKAAGIRCVAAHPHTNGQHLSNADLRGDCCIVFGSEGHGISSAVLSICDDAVAVPMPPHVDSLNVGSASAVFLYEVNRQRGRA